MCTEKSPVTLRQLLPPYKGATASPCRRRFLGTVHLQRRRRSPDASDRDDSTVLRPARSCRVANFTRQLTPKSYELICSPAYLIAATAHCVRCDALNLNCLRQSECVPTSFELSARLISADDIQTERKLNITNLQSLADLTISIFNSDIQGALLDFASLLRDTC